MISIVDIILGLGFRVSFSGYRSNNQIYILPWHADLEIELVHFILAFTYPGASILSKGILLQEASK